MGQRTTQNVPDNRYVSCCITIVGFFFRSFCIFDNITMLKDKCTVRWQCERNGPDYISDLLSKNGSKLLQLYGNYIPSHALDSIFLLNGGTRKKPTLHRPKYSQIVQQWISLDIRLSNRNIEFVCTFNR